jgi:hypothetical protein
MALRMFDRKKEPGFALSLFLGEIYSWIRKCRRKESFRLSSCEGLAGDVGGKTHVNCNKSPIYTTHQ